MKRKEYQSDKIEQILKEKKIEAYIPKNLKKPDFINVESIPFIKKSNILEYINVYTGVECYLGSNEFSNRIFLKSSEKKIFCSFIKSFHKENNVEFVILNNWVEERCDDCLCKNLSKIIIDLKGSSRSSFIEDLFVGKNHFRNFRELDNYLINVVEKLNNYFGFLDDVEKYVERNRLNNSICDAIVFTEKEFKERMKDENIVISIGDEEKAIYISLAEIYINSVYKKHYSEIDFWVYNPKTDSKNSKIFNLFSGWNIIYDQSFFVQEKEILPIINYILFFLCSGDKIKCKRLLDWISNLAQNPSEFTSTGIIFINNSTSNIDPFLLFLLTHIFHPLAVNITNFDNGYHGFWNSTMFKSLIVFSENNERKFTDMYNLFKNRVSVEEPYFYRIDGYAEFEIKSFARYILYLNEKIDLEKHQISDKYILLEIGNIDAKIESNLISFLRTKDAYKKFMHYILNRDISEYSENSQKYPEHFYESCEAFLPLVQKSQGSIFQPVVNNFPRQEFIFLCNFLETNVLDLKMLKIGKNLKIIIRTKKLYKLYIIWCEKYNHKIMIGQSFVSFMLNIVERIFPWKNIDCGYWDFTEKDKIINFVKKHNLV